METLALLTNGSFEHEDILFGSTVLEPYGILAETPLAGHADIRLALLEDPIQRKDDLPDHVVAVL